MRTFNLSLLFGLLLLGFSLSSYASIAVIIHPSNDNKFDERTVRQIFLGQIKTYPDGSEARAFDNLGDANLRSDFITKVLRRNESTMNAYWARMIFTAKATPPQELPDAASVLKMVAGNKQAIGYIDSSQVNDSVRVIVTID